MEYDGDHLYCVVCALKFSFIFMFPSIFMDEFISDKFWAVKQLTLQKCILGFSIYIE